MENEQIMSLTRELSRRQLGRMWQRVKQGEALDNADEARLGKAMKDHARHAVLNVMVEETWHMLREKRVFNVASYRRKLKKLMKRR